MFKDQLPTILNCCLKKTPTKRSFYSPDTITKSSCVLNNHLLDEKRENLDLFEPVFKKRKEYSEFYLDLCNIIGHPDYLKDGVIIGDNDTEDEKNWHIVSTISLNPLLDEELTLWKYIKDDIWDERKVSVRKILQLNAF